jgi:CHAT domain
MSKQWRVIVRLNDDWEGTATCEQAPDWSHKIKLIRLKHAEGEFPGLDVPLHEPGQDHRNLQGLADVAAIKELHDLVHSRTATVTQVATFGHYLFDALLGTTPPGSDELPWETLEQKAEAAGVRFLELALCLPLGDSLQRLNWELMRSDKRFLVAPGKVAVAITRVVDREVEQPTPLDVPPRVLFVVGTLLTETQIRPGAELYALLRQARHGRAMRYRLLERAKPSELRTAIKEFKPQIVHFICHGGREGEPPEVYLDLAHERDNVATKRFAPQLLSDLSQDGWRPTVVVLSACFTGGESGAPPWLAGVHESAPLAGKLVDGGIPIVIGMAGRVADLTSRLFARRLTEAVIKGEPLVRATALARQAAFSDGGNPETAVDWALPTIFMARNVCPTYQPVDVAASDAQWKRLEDWIETAEFNDNPVFCGREDVISGFQRMLDRRNGGKRVLAALATEATKGIGRTRLLQELAAQALREGHLPLLLRTRQEDKIPRDHKQFVEELSTELKLLRTKVLSLERGSPSQLRLLAKGDPDADYLDPALADELEDSEGITDLAVNLALQADLEALIEDAAAKYDDFFDVERTLAIVLLDDIHRYGDELIDGLLDGALLTPMGFGTPERPIPVAMTCARFAGTRDLRFKALQEGAGRGRLEVVPFGAFREGAEDLLASQVVLLNPFKRPSLPGSLNVAYVYDPEFPEDKRPARQELFRLQFGGVPLKYTEDALMFYAGNAKHEGYLKVADDEDRLGKLEKQA